MLGNSFGVGFMSLGAWQSLRRWLCMLPSGGFVVRESNAEEPSRHSVCWLPIGDPHW